MEGLGAALQDRMGEAQRAAQAGDYHRAAALMEGVVRRQRNNGQLLGMLGSYQVSAGQLTEAKRTLRRAIKLRPSDHGLLYELARVHRRDRRLDEAQQCLRRALRIAPRDATCRAALAENLFLKGEYEEAYRELEPLLDGGAVPLPVATTLARVAPRVGRIPEAIAVIEAVLGALPHDRTIQRADTLFRLGGLHDAAGDYARAFEAYAEANRLKHARFDPDAFESVAERAIEAWTPEAFRGAPRSGEPSEHMIFIVGMPRSGTSLVEQILASHPRVYGAGELRGVQEAAARLPHESASGYVMLTRPDLLCAPILAREAKTYLGPLRRELATARRITDKLPLNFLCLQFIALLFPRCRVVHCVRDPLDTCLSCYTHHFSGINAFAYDLRTLGRFYRTYERLMAHWKRILDVPVMEVVYEDLVESQEEHSRRLVEFAGLEWDDACLRFYDTKRDVVTLSSDQVRRPVYRSSVGRHRHYEAYLGPLREALGSDDCEPGAP